MKVSIVLHRYINVMLSEYLCDVMHDINGLAEEYFIGLKQKRLPKE